MGVITSYFCYIYIYLQSGWYVRSGLLCLLVFYFKPRVDQLIGTRDAVDLQCVHNVGAATLIPALMLLSCPAFISCNVDLRPAYTTSCFNPYD